MAQERAASLAQTLCGPDSQIYSVDLYRAGVEAGQWDFLGHAETKTEAKFWPHPVHETQS